jgi:hypothetical protein
LKRVRIWIKTWINWCSVRFPIEIVTLHNRFRAMWPCVWVHLMPTVPSRRWASQRVTTS